MTSRFLSILCHDCHSHLRLGQAKNCNFLCRYDVVVMMCSSHIVIRYSSQLLILMNNAFNLSLVYLYKTCVSVRNCVVVTYTR